MIVSASAYSFAQDPKKPLSEDDSADITLKKIGPPKPELSDDKWALTDEDRMTDKEMDEELFGNGTTGEKDSDANNEASVDLNEEDEEEEVSSKNDDKASAKQEAPLAPRQTIESYLKNINTLTVETSTPPAKSSDGVDTPMRMIPQQSMPMARSQSVASLRFQIPDIHHQPLYFEDQSLERAGVHRCRLQPLESARKFASDTLSLPCNLRQQPRESCVHRQNFRYSQPSLLPAIR